MICSTMPTRQFLNHLFRSKQSLLKCFNLNNIIVKTPLIHKCVSCREKNFMKWAMIAALASIVLLAAVLISVNVANAVIAVDVAIVAIAVTVTAATAPAVATVIYVIVAKVVRTVNVWDSMVAVETNYAAIAVNAIVIVKRLVIKKKVPFLAIYIYIYGKIATKLSRHLIENE